MGPVDDDDRTTGGTLYGLIVGALYVLAVGVQVYLVIDEVTHGALSEDVTRRWRTLIAGVNARRRIDRAVREQTPWVLWEAHEMLESDT